MREAATTVVVVVEEEMTKEAARKRRKGKSACERDRESGRERSKVRDPKKKKKKKAKEVVARAGTESFFLFAPRESLSFSFSAARPRAALSSGGI